MFIFTTPDWLYWLRGHFSFCFMNYSIHQIASFLFTVKDWKLLPRCGCEKLAWHFMINGLWEFLSFFSPLGLEKSLWWINFYSCADFETFHNRLNIPLKHPPTLFLCGRLKTLPCLLPFLLHLLMSAKVSRNMSSQSKNLFLILNKWSIASSFWLHSFSLNRSILPDSWEKESLPPHCEWSRSENLSSVWLLP